MRATLETAPDKSRWNKAQAIFLCTMRDDGLTNEQFDIRWVSAGIRVSVNSAPRDRLPVLAQIASLTIGANWVFNRDGFNCFVPGTDDEIQTLLDDA